MRTHDLSLLAERQHGLVAHRQARALGLSSSDVAELRGSLSWAPVTDEVIRRAGAPVTRHQSILAAVLDAGPDAVLSHLSAASLWGLRGCALRPLHVTRVGHPLRPPRLAQLHTVRRLPARWVCELESIPVVRPELLGLQLFAVCREGRAERLVETLWSMGLLSAASIGHFLDDLGARGRNGTAGLRRYLEPRGMDYAPAASGVEMRAIQILREAGIEMRRQVDSGGDDWTGRVVLRHPELPLIVEVQSERYHTALVDRAADRRRLAVLRGDGFVVVEISDDEVWSRPGAVIRRVEAGIRLLRSAA